MNVHLVVHGLAVGGTERMVAGLARHLDARGHGVLISCLGELGSIGEDLRQEGFAVILHERRAGFDASLALRLAHVTRENVATIVHAHQRTALHYCLLAGLRHRVPILYSEHGPLFDQHPGPRARALRWCLRWRLAGVTAVSRSLARELTTHEGLSRFQAEWIPNSVDVERFSSALHQRRNETRRRLGLDAHQPVVGAVGRLSPVKNLGLLLHAVQRLRTTRADLAVVIVGEGTERNALGALAEQLGLQDCVRFLGAQRAVEEILPAFDVLALTSRSEGIPLCVLEAMAARVPVVATDVGGVRDAMGTDAGTVVAGRPPEIGGHPGPAASAYVDTFAQALDGILADQVAAKAITERAFEQVQRFDEEHVCREYEQALRRYSR